MQLECVVDELHLDLAICDSNAVGQRAITVPLARCRETTCVVSVNCLLSPAREIGQFAWEFSFEIVFDYLDGSQESGETQDRFIAENYIPDDARPMVMRIVTECLAALLTDCAPETVYMVTKDANLPDKALTKYLLLRDSCLDNGYSLAEEGTDNFGRAFWLYDKDH